MEPAIDTQQAGVDSTEEPRPPAFSGGVVRWWRLAYALEFLLAITASAILWSEVGGQVHLEMMPWYLKLGALVAFASAIVRFTMAVVNHEAMWNAASLRWLMAMLALAGAMFAVTLYYHLHEPADDSDDEEGMSTSIEMRGSARLGDLAS